MEKTLIISGFGGQGIMRIGKLLGRAASDQGKNAVYFPSYGTEMRGGAANCTVIISDEKIFSPVRDKYDMLVMFDQLSYDTYRDKLIPGGLIVNNSSLVKGRADEGNCVVLNVDSASISAELGLGGAGNMIILGTFIELSGIIDTALAMETLAAENGSQASKERNLKAFQAGVDLVKK